MAASRQFPNFSSSPLPHCHQKGVPRLASRPWRRADRPTMLKWVVTHPQSPAAPVNALRAGNTAVLPPPLSPQLPNSRTDIPWKRKKGGPSTRSAGGREKYPTPPGPTFGQVGWSNPTDSLAAGRSGTAARTHPKSGPSPDFRSAFSRFRKVQLRARAIPRSVSLFHTPISPSRRGGTSS